MKISKSNLHKCLIFTSGILDNKADGPYSYISIFNKDRQAIITGVGTICSSEINITSESYEEENFIIKGTICDDIINSLDSEIITITLADNKILLKGNKVKIEAPIEQSIPRIIDSDLGNTLIENFELKDFANKLKLLYKITYEGPTEGQQSNIFISDGELRATNGIVFAYTPFVGLTDLVIPRSIVPIINGFAELIPYCNISIHTINETDKVLKLYNNSGNLTFLLGKAPKLLNSTELLQQFELNKQFRISRETLILALKRSLVTTNVKKPEIRFYTKDQSVFVTSEIASYAFFQEIGTAKDEYDLLLNPKIISDILSFSSIDVLDLHLGGPLDPLLIKMGDQNVLIMPLSKGL